MPPGYLFEEAHCIMLTGKPGKAIDGALDHIGLQRRRLSDEYRADLGWKVAYCHHLAAELQQTALTATGHRLVAEILDVLEGEEAER